jgi:hypothetical protein
MTFVTLAVCSACPIAASLWTRYGGFIELICGVVGFVVVMASIYWLIFRLLGGYIRGGFMEFFRFAVWTLQIVQVRGLERMNE